jgi:hypothetical protein
MDITEIKKIVSKLPIDPKEIPDPNLRGSIVLLLNIVETCLKVIDDQKKEIQLLKDEINRLKGEQGKPTIRSQKKDTRNISSEKERRSIGDNEKKEKPEKNKMAIHETRLCPIDKTTLPADAVFKGYNSVVVQDILINPNNIEFKKEIYYSASEKTTYRGKMPEGYGGKYGPGIKSLILQLNSEAKMSEPTILQFLSNFGICISAATISRILLDNAQNFHQEKKEIVSAGLASTHYQQIDDTAARENGMNKHTHVLCNPYYTAYFTLPSKDRLSILKMLCGGESYFCMDSAAYEWMCRMNLSSKQLLVIKPYLSSNLLTERQIQQHLSEWFPNPRKHQTNRRIILEACALSAYSKRDDTIETLICDDAPQFKLIAQTLGLCWIHEGRHYKRLNPFIPSHRKLLETFLDEFWEYYRQLLEYKKSPSFESAGKLESTFDRLFSEKTGYDVLDKQKAKTLAKKQYLLLVLYKPDIPLHNNRSELGARAQARKRDISLQTKNKKGTEAKDTYMTIVQTAKKLGINVYEYIFDRVSKRFKMAALSDLIKQASGKAMLFNDST